MTLPAPNGASYQHWGPRPEASSLKPEAARMRTLQQSKHGQALSITMSWITLSTMTPFQTVHDNMPWGQSATLVSAVQMFVILQQGFSLKSRFAQALQRHCPAVTPQALPCEPSHTAVSWLRFVRRTDGITYPVKSCRGCATAMLLLSVGGPPSSSLISAESRDW